MMASKRSPLPLCRLAASLAAVGSLLLCTVGVSHAAQPAPPPALARVSPASGGANRAAAQRAAHARAMTRVTLVLKWVPQAQFAGYYVALKKGCYAREGLDVRIQPGGPDIVPESVVENGEATFGIDWLPSLLTQRDHG